MVEETGELQFREAPDYEAPADVESAEPESGAGDNEYVVVVEVRSGEGERERKGERAIRVRVTDEEEPPEITSLGPFEVVENGRGWGSWRRWTGRRLGDTADAVPGGGTGDGGSGRWVSAETGERGAGDNESVVEVEVRGGEPERERKGERVIRVRVTDEEEAEVVGDGTWGSWRRWTGRGDEIGGRDSGGSGRGAVYGG